MNLPKPILSYSIHASSFLVGTQAQDIRTDLIMASLDQMLYIALRVCSTTWQSGPTEGRDQCGWQECGARSAFGTGCYQGMGLPINIDQNISELGQRNHRHLGSSHVQAMDVANNPRDAMYVWHTLIKSNVIQCNF